MTPCANRGRSWLRPGIGAAGLFALAATGLMAGLVREKTFSAVNDHPPAAIASANDLSTAFRYASEKVMPSVVTVHAVGHEPRHIGAAMPRNHAPGQPNDLAPFLKRFFGDEFPQMPEMSPHAPRSEGTGSGFIIDPSGIILTNNHVVNGAEKVTVRLHDGREFEAVQVKTDPKTDVAVIRIKGAGNLPAATLGNSDSMQVGDWVLAIGTPFGLQETVTAGIISAKSRGIGISEREDFLQTDAAMNPGNSGGPLVNLRGEVVGINTAISTHSGGSEGVGFAIPINLARWVGKQLVDTGSVQRAFLGVGIQPLTSDLSKQFGLSTMHGVVVTEVRPDTAAAKAGLKVGDVVLEFDGHAVNTARELQGLVEQSDLKAMHKIAIDRNGKHESFEVNLQAMAKAAVAESGDQAAKGEFSSLGLDVADMTHDVAQKLGLKNTSGVVVTAVAAGSAAESAGIKEGMVISRVGKADVANVDGFRAAVAKVNVKEGVLLLVRSSEGSRFVVLKTG